MPRSERRSGDRIVSPSSLASTSGGAIPKSSTPQRGAVASTSATAAAAGVGVTATSTPVSSGGRGTVLQTLKDPRNYEELNVIGNGAYGTVFRARDKTTDTIVALKKMKFFLTEDGVPMAILREISLLKQLEKFDHPNIVRLLDICHGPRLEKEMSLYLVFEHVHQDLASYLEKCPPPGLAKDRIKDIIWQILSGVDFLHSHRIVHRDLKPQNLLVTKDGIVKLADFGLARIYDFSSLLTTVVVTLWYRSPEILLGTTYATPVDLWSCGCILAELFLRRPLFPGQYEVDQLGKIFGVLGTPSEAEWPANSSVVREAFSVQHSQGLDSLMAGLDPQALDH